MAHEPKPRLAHLLNRALAGLLREDPAVLVLGEDVVDPYGGAFKVTRGLSSEFGDRVLSTPISEAGIVGLGVGLALGGFRPVVEIMFGDFITLAADQLINQAAKMATMFGRPVDLPLVVRTPMGGGRGYGPTHSQSLERLFLGVPGLDVVAASALHDPGELLRAAVLGARPTLFIENKLLYARPLVDDAELAELGWRKLACGEPYPTLVLDPGEPPDVTLLAYGGMASLALAAAVELRSREGLACEIVVPHRLSPLDPAPLRRSAARTRRVVVAEEGIGDFGFGAEASHLAGTVGLEAPVQRVAAACAPIPARRDLEDRVLPGVADLVRAAVATVDQDFLNAKGAFPC